MDEQNFREHLTALGHSTEEIDSQVKFIASLEANLDRSVPSWMLKDLNPAFVQSMVDEMIDRGENTVENLATLARYAKVIENTPMYETIFHLLDGFDVMENLYEKLAAMVGEDLRDIIFEDMPLPPLGLSRREKARYTYRIMRRLEEIFEESMCRRLLDDSLHNLPNKYYASAKTDFYVTCEGDMDRYLLFKRQKFIESLKDHFDRGELFCGQEITEEVIGFVESNVEIGGGVREGSIIYETKIPANTKAFLAETDPQLKKYHYCHCPWAKESLRSGALTVPATFCQCSAGFQKRPYEFIFDQPLKAEVLQSLLNGDPVCRFAIHLPSSA